MTIINIGDELLLGQVVNTNSAFIGQKLALKGIKVSECVTVGDNREEIANALRHGFEKDNFVITTGGLGPTKDDITKEVICEHFNKRLVRDAETLEWVSELLASRGMELTETNRTTCRKAALCLKTLSEPPRDFGFRKEKRFWWRFPACLSRRRNFYAMRLFQGLKHLLTTENA